MNRHVQSFSSESLGRAFRSLMTSPSFAQKISWLVLILVIIMLTNFSWKLWSFFQPRDPLTLHSISSTSNTNKADSFNINTLKTYQLFGSATETTSTSTEDPINAPITRLKLKLRGVYSAQEEKYAGAMIEAQNKQQVYRIGDSLPGAAGLKLHQILADRVIMSRSGKFETLLIEDFGPKAKSSNRSTNRTERQNNSSTTTKASSHSTIDKRNDRNLTEELLKLRTKLSDPQSLNELVSVTPAIVEGEFQGFRLAPGKNRALFARMGLRRNDLVLSVNGISLDNPASAFSLMEQISTADEINLEVKRGSRNVSIMFSAQAQ